MVIKDAIEAVSGGLKGSPVVFGLVTINVMFVFVVLFLLYSVSASIARRDQMISDILAKCFIKEGQP